MSKFLGYDGKEYDTVIEWSRANERWEREKSQKESLERQEKLIEQQNELLEEQIENQRQLVEEQMENDEWIEYERQEHDREMRILSLCDEIGISEKLISNYITYVLSSTEMRKEDQDEYDELCKDIDKIEEKISKINTDKELAKNKVMTDFLSNKRTLTQLKQFNVYFLEKCDDPKIVSLFEEKSICLRKLPIWFLISFIWMFIMLPFLLSAHDIYLFLLLILIFCPMIFFLVKAFNYIAIKNAIKEECDKKIDELNNGYQKIQKDNEENKKNEQLSQLTKKKSDYLQQKLLVLENSINGKLEDFYKFRLKHYNSKLEKFLVDYEFEQKVKNNSDLNINYKVVTKSMATGNGDIDDYVEYFNNVIRK